MAGRLEETGHRIVSSSQMFSSLSGRIDGGGNKNPYAKLVGTSASYLDPSAPSKDALMSYWRRSRGGGGGPDPPPVVSVRANPPAPQPRHARRTEPHHLQQELRERYNVTRPSERPRPGRARSP